MGIGAGAVGRLWPGLLRQDTLSPLLRVPACISLCTLWVWLRVWTWLWVWIWTWLWLCAIRVWVPACYDGTFSPTRLYSAAATGDTDPANSTASSSQLLALLPQAGRLLSLHQKLP